MAFNTSGAHAITGGVLGHFGSHMVTPNGDSVVHDKETIHKWRVIRIQVNDLFCLHISKND